MSGYRDQTGYDPNSYEQPGAPLRPFNWVQWCGVALDGVGIIVFVAYLLGRAGLVPSPLGSPLPGVGFLVIGALLITSRRQPGGAVRTTSRRTLVVINLALVAAAIALAAVIYFQGA